MSNLHIVWLQNFSDCFRESSVEWQCDKEEETNIKDMEN